MDEGEQWVEAMRQGDFEAAWRLSDKARGEHLWNGTPLAGKRVILRCDRGIGDAIQFIRFVPMLASVAAEVTVWSRPDAVPLLRRARGVQRVVPWEEQVEGDVTLDIMQLAHVFRTTLDTIPREVPYLDVEPLPLDKQRIHVGVGLKTSKFDPRRDVPEELLEAVAAVSSNAHSEDRPFEHDDDASASDPSTSPGTTQPEIHRLDQPVGPATPLDTARLVKALDLVITADTFYAHLAGALAVPVWTLLPFRADWRWMADRADSPWYPTMRLFRQPSPGDWHAVIREVAVELCYLPRTIFHRS